MRLDQALKDGGVDIAAVAELLSGASVDARVDQLFALDRAGQRRLFELAEGAPPLTLADFVPEGTPAGQAVHHRGRNTLPLPRKHRLFEKRFCAPGDGTARLFGYNHAASKGLIGPGYFVAVPTAGNAEWERRGAVVVDYFQVPPADAAVPAGWPPIVPNERGLSRFVYAGTRDFMRGVADGVSIGAAYKGEKPLGHFFVLVRED